MVIMVTLISSQLKKIVLYAESFMQLQKLVAAATILLK